MAKKKIENENVETPEIVNSDTAVNEKDEVTTPKKETTPVKEEEKKVIGVVTDCLKLNIRNKPKTTDSKILVEVPALSELEIDKEKSTDKWYKVTTASGVSGFCMKDFVKIKR